MTGSAPGYLTEQFIKRSDVSKRSTRNAQALDIPLFRSASGQKTFYYQVVSLWNSLTPKLKLCQSQREFKQSLKRLLFNRILMLINFSFYYIHSIFIICIYRFKYMYLFNSEKPH